MKAFPADIRAEISKRVVDFKNIQKDEWKGKKREYILSNLVKVSASGNSSRNSFSYRFELGRYLWNVEICKELVYDFDVQIYLSKIDKNEKDEKLSPCDWVHAEKYDICCANCKPPFIYEDMYCIIKL